MKILKPLIILFLAIIYLGTAQGKELTTSYFETEYLKERYNQEGDIRSKALTIMKMIDESKGTLKEKTLLILLEVELNILKDKINEQIERCKHEIDCNKRSIETANKNDFDDEEDMMEHLLIWNSNIEHTEKAIHFLEEHLLHIKQWKRDYCK